MTENLDQLRQVAERATPGPWEREGTGVLGAREAWDLGNGPARIMKAQMPWQRERMEANAEHVATFDPPTVLGLIERVEAAERCFDEADSIKIEHEGAIQRVREEHPLRFYDKWMRESAEPQGYGGWCASCGRFDGDSCPTIRALDGGEQE